MMPRSKEEKSADEAGLALARKQEQEKEKARVKLAGTTRHSR